MRNFSRARVTALLLTAVSPLIAASTSDAAAIVTVDSSAPWQGFMNVFEIPAHGGGYVFGSGWGTADLVATFSGATLTLAPNSVNDTSSFWYTPSGGPGATGNKTMDANMYVQSDGPLSGQNVTFTGVVLSNSLVSPYTSVAFIKDFAPDFSSNVTTTVPLSPGVFSISMNTINDPARHVQYGFETIGPDVWITDAPAMGNVQVTAIPEPTSLAFVGLALLGLAGRPARK